MNPPAPAPVVETPEPEAKKRGRKPKVEKVEPSTETRSVSLPDSYGTFEYHVTDLKASDVTELQTKLNELGKERWELCGFDTNKSLFGSIHIVAVFKRKRG